MHSAEKNISVLIVDDHPILRDAIAHFVNREDDLCVCGEAEGAEEALALIQELHPTIVILDLGLKQGDGLEVLRKMKEEFPRVKVLVFSGRDESVYAGRAIQAGASGFVGKEETLETLISALRKVLSGDIYVSETLQEGFLRGLVGSKPGFGKSSVESLSDRELQIFELFGKGLGIVAIAGDLGLSTKTVEAHRTNIIKKLNLSGTTQLMHAAVHWVHGKT